LSSFEYLFYNENTHLKVNMDDKDSAYISTMRYRWISSFLYSAEHSFVLYVRSVNELIPVYKCW